MCPVPNSNNQSINIICSYRCSRYVPVAYRTAKSHLVKVGVIVSYRTFSNFNEAKNLKSFDLPFQKSPCHLYLDLHGYVKILFESKPSQNLQKQAKTSLKQVKNGNGQFCQTTYYEFQLGFWTKQGLYPVVISSLQCVKVDFVKKSPFRTTRPTQN